MTHLTLNGIPVEDTFAEAFDVAGTALIVTNDTARWAMIAATVMTGFATSVIGCGAEAGIDAELSPEETPDGRPGVRILLFGFEPNGLKDQLIKRVGQCILTCPGTAAYAGVDGPTKIKLGGAIRYFGDGFAVAKRLPDETGKLRRYWRIPVMDGEFLCEDFVRAVDGAVGGGNLLFLGRKH
ncbi:formylmethanofuran--tetrahydromethanopterin N-formyltransferase, partial [Methylobacterium hispanicum]